MSQFGLSTSMEWVYFNSHKSTDLVRRKEVECWNFLFHKKSTDYIQEKLNDALNSKTKAIIVPAKSLLVCIDPYNPEKGVVDQVSIVLHKISTAYDVALRTFEKESIPLKEAPPIREKRVLTPKEQYCFNVLFEGKSIKTIEEKLNLVWLPASEKVKIIPVVCELVVFDGTPENLIVETQNVLQQMNRGFSVDLVSADSSKFALMQVAG